MWKTIKYILDYSIPRFITENVVLNIEGDMYEIICSLKDVEEWETYDGIATVRSFNFFGKGYFVKVISDVRPFVGNGEVSVGKD